MAPDPLRWVGKGAGLAGGGGGSKGRGKKKVIPCIGAAGGIAQMMLRWEGHVGRKKKPNQPPGLMFLYLQPHQAGRA